MEENMYARFQRLAAKDKKLKEEAIDTVNEESGIGHIDAPKLPEIKKIDFEKLKKTYQAWEEKNSSETDDLSTDPRFSIKHEEGELGELSRTLNIDTIIDLDAKQRDLLNSFNALTNEWTLLHKKWEEQKKSYDKSYEKLEESLWEIFMSVRENAAAGKVTKLSPTIELEFQDAKGRAFLMNAQVDKINDIRDRAKKIHDQLVTTMDNTTGYIMDSVESTGVTSRRVVRILMALFKVQPADAAKLHLAALNAVFARMEAKSEQARATVETIRAEIKKTQAKMLQKYAKDQELGVHLYDGDSELLIQIAKDMNDPQRLNELHDTLKSKTDQPAPSATTSELPSGKENLLPADNTSVSSVDEADGSAESIKQLLNKHKRKAGLLHTAMGFGFTEMVADIGDRARHLHKLIDALDDYCTAAAHQLEAKGIEVDLPKTEEEAEETFEGMELAPSFAKKKTLNIDKTAK